MHKKYCLVLFTTFVFLLFHIIPFITYAQEADNRLFRSPAPGFANTLSGKKMLAEQMIVYVDFNVLKGEEGHAPNLLLEIFGQSFQVDQTRVDERDSTDYAWCGKAKDGSISNVVLTVGDKIMFGRIEYLDSVYVVEPVEEGPLHRITKIDPTKVMPFGNDALIPPQNLKPEAIAPQSSLKEPLSAALDDGSVIDIMVLYTDGMASAYPGTQIDTKIHYLVDLANNAYTNSLINTSLNIVKTQQVSYTDGDSLLTALYELFNGTGVLSNVAAWRNTYRADVVTLLRKYQDTNNSCGKGYINSKFAPYAINVVQEDSTFCDDYTLAHEVGHNMGCDHDRGNTTSPAGAYDYSFGYTRAAAFGTIMSYYRPQVGYFSNPNVIHSSSGLPMGVPEGQSDSADNAKTINNTKSIVANFRGKCPYSISSTSKTSDSSGGTDSVNVTTYDGCDWSAASNVSWITIDSDSSGTGSGTVSYTISANTGTNTLTGTMTIAGETFTVTQSGG